MRTYTREQVEQVVDAYAQECVEKSRTMSSRLALDMFARGIGAREVLRRLDALPASAPPSPARGVPDGFGGTLDHVLADVRYGGDAPGSHVHQLRILMFRFPDGSLAPHVEAVEGAPYAGECLMELTTLVHLMRNVGHMEAFQIGSRELPAAFEAHPWPEPPLPPQPIHSARPDGTFVPPLPHQSPPCPKCGAPTSRGYVLCDACPDPISQRPREPTPVPSVPALKDEPTAPEVVWASDWMRVLADGTCQRTWPEANGTWTDCNATALCTLARALAEAKREQRCDHGQPKEYCAQSFNDAVDAAKGLAPSERLTAALNVIREALRHHGCTFPGGGLVGIANGVDEVVYKAVGRVADEVLGMLHRGRVADAITTLTAAKQVTP